MTINTSTPLRRLRTTRGIRLEEMAAELGMNNGTLSRIERGQGTTPETAAKIVKFFGHGITEMEILYPERFPAVEPTVPSSGDGHASA